MNCLSPEVQKVTENAQARRGNWWPRLTRTKEKLVILRPASGGGSGFAKFMAVELPAFKFNRCRNWWEARLAMEIYEAVVRANSVKLNRDQSEVQLHISVGVQDWVHQVEDGDSS